MDRTTVYPGQVPRALDNLQLGEFAMVGLAKLSEAMLGTTTVVSQGGFAVSPGGGLNIAVAAGQIYQLQSIEPTADSALPVNGTQVLKQGIALNAQTLTLAPPSTVGYAQNYLLQVAYDDVPDGSLVLSYQNPTPVQDPATGALRYVTYPGPGGNGEAQYTILRGGVSVIAKPGTPAPSGSQSTPPPDAGYVGLYVITLAYGATSIAPGNISPYTGAPFLPFTIPQIPAAIQAQVGNYAVDTGTANAMALTLPSYTPSTLADGTPIRFKKGANPNTGATSVVINGTTYAVQTAAGAPLTGGELAGNATGGGIILGGALRLTVAANSGSAIYWRLDTPTTNLPPTVFTQIGNFGRNLSNKTDTTINASTGAVTIGPTDAGVYVLSAGMATNNSGTANCDTEIVAIAVNGTWVASDEFQNPGNAQAQLDRSTSCVLKLAAGDVVTCLYFQGNPSGVSVPISAVTYCQFSGVRIGA